MRVSILAIGSRGDVQPFLALGRGLAAEGHHVLVATHPRFEAFVRAHGLAFAPIAEGDLSRGSRTTAGRRWIESDAKRLPTWVGFVRDARSVAAQRLADAAAASADAETIIASNLAMVLGWQMAAHRAVPLVRAYIGPPAWMLGRRAAPHLAPVMRQLAWSAAQPWLNRVRRAALGWPALPAREPFTQLDRLRAPVLYAFSSLVLTTPSAGGHGEITGFWFTQDSLDPPPPPALEAFLAAGEAPVTVGFSTMIDADPARRTRLAAEALRRAGVRGVLQGPAEAPDRPGLAEDLISVGSVAHDWLFPRCAAVVHHGAVGTTAAALRAGVPAVAVPHMTDQFVWARRLHELGVSPPPIPRRELTAARLAQAIDCVMHDDDMRSRAHSLGAQIRAETGVQRAVAALARDVLRPAPTPSPRVPTPDHV